MKKHFSTTVSIITIILFTSCEKSESVSKKLERPEFYASYGDESYTKGSSIFTSGNKVTILGFVAGANTTSGTPVSGTPVEATCGASGILTPISSVFLPKGNYDFYSVSQNSINSPVIVFSSGVSNQLSNGVDYLWANCKGVSQGGIASFVYYHKAVGMEINVTAGTGISNLTVTSIGITPTAPDASSKMYLSNGSIGDASNIGSLTPVSLNGLSGKYIMLPVSATEINIELTINATIGGTAVTSKKYTASIPSQAYTSGCYYTINLTVSTTAVQFSGAMVEDWINQTISGISLTEQ